MAGNPKRHADLVRLGQQAELCELVWARLEEGVGYSKICMETGLGKAALLQWLEEPANAERASRARARAALSLADESVEIADESGDAKLRIGTRQWMAERFNRVQFGQKVDVAVSGHVTHQHLAALQQRKQAPAIQASEPVVLDVVSRVVPTKEELDAL